MSIQTIRRSVLAAAILGALAVSGLVAGRLFARGVGEGSYGTAPRMFHRLARALDLTDQQRSQVRGILKAHATEIETQVRAGVTARRALHDAVLTQPMDETGIRSRAAELGNVHADGAVLFAKIHAEIAPILTQQQKDKLQEFRDRMRQRGEESFKSLDEWLRSGN